MSILRTNLTRLGAATAASAALVVPLVAVTATLTATPASASATSSMEHTSRGNVGTLEATLHDPGGALGDFFGYDTAVSGDVAVVGAPQRETPLEGEAYIYVKGAQGWPTTPTVTLKDPAATNGDDFGFVVAVSHKTVVVGALNTDDAQGAAYIYSEGAHGWPKEPTVTLQDPGATDQDGFGQSVAVEGKTIVVGAYQSDAANGAAYIYQEGPSGWPTTPTLTLSHPSDRGEFGDFIGIAGDTIAVGADFTDEDSGAAYLYVKGASGWPTSPTTTISDPAATENDDFPSSVALSKSTLVFGEYEADGGIGAAYIYAHGPSGWPTAPTATLPAPASSGHQFGESVATSGDTVIVTSFDAPVSGYVYTEASGVWPTTPTGTLTGRPAPSVVSMSGTTAVIGDFGYNDFEGLAKIFEL